MYSKMSCVRVLQYVKINAFLGKALLKVLIRFKVCVGGTTYRSCVTGNALNNRLHASCFGAKGVLHSMVWWVLHSGCCVFFILFM